MATRRQFIMQTSALLGTAPLVACTTREQEYQSTAKAIWRHSSGALSDKPALLRELVRYATPASSSHNTQCWKFKIEEDPISVLPDFLRRCPAVDSDDHHLFVSLGYATENLVQAALANGLNGDVSFDATSGIVNVALESTKAVVSALFNAWAKLLAPLLAEVG